MIMLILAMNLGGDKMRSYIYDSVKFSDGKRLITRYTTADYLFLSIVKFLLFLFVVWPFELFIWWPIKLLFKLALMLLEFVVRGIWWLIRLPFTLIFGRRLPDF